MVEAAEEREGASRFAVATSNGPSDWRLGKLWVARGYNYPVVAPTQFNIEIAETYTYAGKQGRVSKRDTTGLLDGSVFGAFTQSWTWNDLGDRASTNYPRCTHSGCTATFPRTVSSTYTNGFLTAVPGYASAISYHANGQVNQVTHVNHPSDSSKWVVDTYLKDLQNMARPQRIQATLGGTIRWNSGLYSFDGAGNVTRTGNDYYVYDRVSRIKDGLLYLGPGGAGITRSFNHTYDGFGNLQSLTANGALRNTPTNSSTNRLTGSVSYDAAGNLTFWNGATYRYDRLNQMWGMTNGAEDWLYLYTADGERLWSFKVGGNFSRWTVRDLDGKVLTEYNVVSNLWTIQRDYVYRGGQLLSAATNDALPNNLIQFHLDHLGTPRAITNRDGNRTSYHVYYPFGEEATAFNQNVERMKFTGHERDLGNLSSAADDLDYMHARFYNPQTGRFLSTDPVESALLTLPQSWNKYAYVLGNPLKYEDPNGESPTIATAAIGAGIGGVLGGAGSIAAQLIRKGEINWRDVGAAAAGGVVSGGLAGGTLGLSLVVQGGAAGVIGVAAVSNTVGGAVERALDSSEETRPGDIKEVAIDLAAGAAGGVVGAKVGDMVKAPLPQLERQIAASQPGARQGNFGAAGSVRGHTAKAQQTRTQAEVAATVAGAKTTNVVVPATRAALQEEERPPRP